MYLGVTEKPRVEESQPQLVERAVRGDHAAFQALVEKHLKYLFALAYSLVGGSADAEDVVQESLTGAYRGLSKFKGGTPVKLWLGGIVTRQAARFHLKRRLRRTKSIEDLSDGQMAQDAAVLVGTSATAVDRRLDIEAFLRRLSEPHRQVIVLRELHGFSYEEISEILGVPRGTVESRLFRARAELAVLLKGYAGGS